MKITYFVALRRMAEIISNSAISSAPSSGSALVASAGTIPGRKKWQTLNGSLPLCFT